MAKKDDRPGEISTDPDGGDIGTTADRAATGPTAKDLRNAGYSIANEVDDDAVAFAYTADTVILDPNDPLAVQELIVPTGSVNNTMTANQFAKTVSEGDDSTGGGPTGGGHTTATGDGDKQTRS